ncbi:hypothetical protein DPMN_137999 [Dreissena polymorpha]|uniref:Uncharacterized protein n=1 Tax=Dreissena polymorpha TaxID=45954 RepID=A0A9D4G5T1_DREPO|nr:hypothetical protein DPMN_137999 [Dreissena polymorpha]
MARKGTGREKISKNTIGEESTESPPKGATPPPMDFEDQDAKIDVADSETCGATGEGAVTMTGDLVTNAAYEEPNTSSRS